MAAAEGSDTVKVAIRCRGLNRAELESASAFAINIHPETNQIEAGKKHFTFDGVFGPESTQEDVYSRSVQPLVHSFLSGLNSSILAYGQTGAGKTYTMGSNFTEHTTASEAARTLGVIPRVVEEVLDAIASQRGESLCSLEVSFLEVYNEQVRDLLRPADVPEPKKGYQFQKDDFGNYDVRGLTHVPLDSLEALARVLKLGASRRTTASTQMNATSSRSHAIFSMRLEQTPIGAEDDGSVGAPHAEAGGAAAAAAAGAPAAGSDAEDAAPALMEATGVKRVSVFRLVDLAGSERSKKTKAEGDRLREANNINQSLVTLGRCITALASRAKHVPFRQSKLTQLLSNSLGGNSATLMVACVSPADSNFEETCMTLSYAQQAASIQNTPVVNADPTSASAVQLRHANHELRNELARLYAEGAAVDSGVLGRHGIAGGAAPSPCPGRRALSRTGAATRAAAAGPGGLGLGAGMGMTGMASMPVGAMGSALSAVAAAHSAAEQMRQREGLAAAGADVARLEGQLQAARAALTEMSDRGRWAVGQASSLLDENTELASQRDMWRWRYETLSGAFSKLEGAGAASAAAKAGITPAERVAEALKEAGEAAALSAMNRARAEMAALRAEQPARSGPGGATGKAAGGRRVSKRKLAAKRAAAAAATKAAAAQSEGASAQESKTGEDGGEARPLCCEDDEDVDMGGPASGCAAGSSDEEAGGDDSASAASDEEDAHGDSDDDEEEQEEEEEDDDDDDDDASHADAAAGDHGEEEEAHGPTEHDVIHIKSQMELRGQLQQVSAVLHEKQQLLMAMAAASGGSGDQTGMSVGERFDKLKADFQLEMRRSEAEVTDMEEKMRALAADLEEAKKEAVRARDDAEKEAKAKAASQKDDVLKGLRAKIQTMQRGMQEAARAQKRRDRELSRIQALQGQIEGHKREKVKLEKIMREAGKKYLEERKAHEHDRAQAAKRERAQALALKRYQQELQRQGRALEAAKQRVRTLKQKDELAKSRNASARRQRAAARRGRAGHAAAAPGSQKPHAAGDPLSAALAAGPSNPLGSPDVRLPLRAASAAAGAHGHGYGQTASRAGASGRGHRDLVTDTEGLHEAVARLIERAAAEAAGSQTDIEAEDALQESLEVGDEASLVACHAAPRGVDSNCRSLVMRTIYYRIQAAGWRSVAEAAVERRAAAAKELHALVQGAAARSAGARRGPKFGGGGSGAGGPTAGGSSSSSSSSSAGGGGSGSFLDAGPDEACLGPDEAKRADSLRRDMVALTLRVQHAQAQTQAFAAALEGEGLGGSGWIRRAAAETPLRSKARQALAGRLLSWVMAMLVQAQAALQTATGTGIAAREGLGSTASGSGNGPASRGGRAGGRLGSAAAAGATQAELQEAVERAERSLKQELWRVQCEAAAAQREDAERVAVLQVQLVQARAEAAKAAGTAWAAEAEADAEEAAEEGGASGGSAGAADLGGEGKSAPKGSGPAGAGAACGEAGKDGRVRRMASVVSENQRLRGCIAEMEAMLGSYCDKSAAEADAAREASEAVDTLLQRVGALEQQLDAERRRANAAAAAPRRLSIVSTSPAPGKGGQAGRGHAAGSRSAAAEALRSMGGRAVHRMGATAEGDDEEDDDEDDHDHDIGRGMSSSGSASALPSVSEISAHLTLAFPGMSEGEHEDEDSPMAKSDMGPPAGFRGHSRSSSGASAHGGKHGPSRLRGLILTTSERRASAVGGPGAGHAEAAAAAVAAEEQSAKLSRRDGGSPVAKRPRDSSGTALPAAASSSAAASAAAAAAASSAGRSGGGSGAGTGSGGVVSPAAATAGSLDAAKGTTGGPDLDEEAGEARKRPRVSGGASAALATSAGSAGADTHAASTSAAAPSGAAAAAAAAASGLAAASAAADSDDSGDEFAGNGVGFEAMTSGAGLGGTGGLMGSGHPSLIEAAYAQQAAEGRALRSRRSKYVAPKGFGSTTARGAPEHGTRVEERRRDAEAMISRDPAAIAAGAAAGITVAGAGATSSSGAPGFAPARVTVALPPAASSAAPPRPPAAHGHSAAGAASSASGAQSEPESEADADGGSKARTRARSSKQARERLAKFLGEPKGSRRMSGAGIADGGEGGKGRRTRQRLAEAAPDDKENSGATDASGKAAPPTRLGRSKLLPRS